MTHRAVLIRIWCGGIWFDRITTSVEVASDYIHWMHDRGHHGIVPEEVKSDRPIPTLEPVKV